MKTIQKRMKLALLSVFAVLIFVQCEDDLPVMPDTEKGTANVQMTDAPSDDANVKAAFVTISEVKIDGETFDGFDGKTTFDIMAYQNGDVKALGLGELEAGSYSEITVVLDYEMDAEGNIPGCYVLTMDDVKHELSTTTSDAQEEIVLAKDFMIEANQTTDLVIDFDIRKAIKYEDESTTTADNQYEFVSKTELETSLRTVVEAETGMVKGKVEDSPTVDEGDRIVVYAYQKGTFDKDMETQGQGESEIMFKNAVTSAVVNAEGDYQLSFLEEGDYELHYASYNESNDGSMMLLGFLQVNSLLSINDISVSAEATLTLDITIIGILPI